MPQRSTANGGVFGVRCSVFGERCSIYFLFLGLRLGRRHSPYLQRIMRTGRANPLGEPDSHRRGPDRSTTLFPEPRTPNSEHPNARFSICLCNFAISYSLNTRQLNLHLVAPGDAFDGAVANPHEAVAHVHHAVVVGGADDGDATLAVEFFQDG
jgi:hypothetical protein